VLANDKIPNMIYFGDATMSFEKQQKFGQASPARHVEIADINNDGHPDLIISNRKTQNEIWLNDGNGVYRECVYFGDQGAETIQAVAVDLNGDGYPDVVTAERGGKNKIFINDGHGEFAKIIAFGNE